MMGIIFNRRKLLTDRRLLGRWGEKYCHRFLKKQGLKPLSRNFSCKTGEIDMIMVDTDSTIAFIEVRTKADEIFNSVESSITAPKKARLLRTARYFITTYNIDDRPFRFDIVTIVLPPKGSPQIRHYKNAFVP
ncbi:MAG: YraN family protein [Sedimentisphaerales bacterium]|nr:YraN family protein [Sedimentisphaerales bacterium]